ncbi:MULTISPECIES: DUF4375 domain-containing protein [unclassified Paenibacillus]|uniref:DMP19 family protein n=1 Tax=unclassified Paenibacillus TaxID=185978 RepID=UPI002789980F|nr:MULTISPECIES: DUF4375 domain-containing protein [unclassified Paenibacillus]MDQ0899206.1 hypothetical protein [Paenibacillus sp. V4I7]MDQ0914804.1 hypothetical protein [Paenibacillus sp. V4I5]
MVLLQYEDWQPHWQKLFEKLDKESYSNLTTDERIWYNVRGVIDSISDGGIISFYYNSGADTMEDTLEDLYKINASQVVDQLKKVNLLFPNGKTPQNIDERNEVINSWNDGEHDHLFELFETLDNQFYNELSEDLETKLKTVVKRIIQT